MESKLRQPKVRLQFQTKISTDPIDTIAVVQPVTPRLELRAPCGPIYKSAGGNTELIEGCGNTVQYVQNTFHLVAMTARRAMQFAQQEGEWKRKPSAEDMYVRYPILKDEGANLKEITELIESKPGSPDAQQWAAAMYSRNLQIPSDTIMRYARKEPRKP